MNRIISVTRQAILYFLSEIRFLPSFSRSALRPLSSVISSNSVLKHSFPIRAIRVIRR